VKRTLAVMMLLSSAGLAARERLPLDTNWKFTTGDPAAAQDPAFADTAWRGVTLPHDWSIEGKIDKTNPTGGSGGFFPAGVGWYRRVIDAPANWKGKRVSIEFGGVYKNASVYLNGELLGMHPNGYTGFWFDLSSRLKYGARNTIAVRVDNSQQENSRWYSGSGIYRHVWMTVTDPVHLEHWGVFVTTPEVSAERARVVVETRAVSESGRGPVLIETTLIGPDGKPAAKPVSRQFDNQAATVTQELEVARPSLWSPETPTLYRAVTRVTLAGKLVDEVETPFGIRTLAWSAEKGFLLNGRSIKLIGGSLHHDNGPLGAAAFDRAEERRVQLLKAAGYNMLRTSHNPPSEAFLDAADRLGMLIMDESFDCWEQAKKPFDYHLDFKDWWQRDLDAMLLRDRNHPSIVIWSIGNEIPERGLESGARLSRLLSDYVRQRDRSRPVTSAANDPREPWTNVDNFFAPLDIAGYNYNLNRRAADHERAPSRIMLVTESYQHDAFNYWQQSVENPYVLGDIVWTALDYLGENGIGHWYYPGPGDPRQTSHANANLWPWHSAYCGDVDITGNRKPASYYRNIVWKRGDRLYLTVKEPSPAGKRTVVTAWGVYPTRASWTWPGEEGKEMEVEAYSNYDRVRLFLNDKLLGEAATGVGQQFKAVFKVPYAPGTLRVAGMEGERQAEEKVLETAADAARIHLTPDRASLRAGEQDLAFVTVEVTDRRGLLQPNANPEIQFSLSGPGVIQAVGNADMTSDEPYQGNQRRAYYGRCLVVVRTTSGAGTIELTAASPGLQPATVRIRSTRN
jgi:beta-galactosidase